MREIRQQINSVIEILWSAGPTNAVQEFFGPGWSWFFHAVTTLGEIYTVVVVLSLALWLGGRRLAYGLIGVIALATVVDAILWTLVGVPRPDDPDIVTRVHLGVSSFPSGHTVMATVLWGTLAAFSRVPWVVPALIIPGVMLSRLYLGAHFLGDVLGGAVIGLLLVAAYTRLWPTLRRRLSGRSFWFFLIPGLCAPFAILFFVGLSPRGWELFGIALAGGIGLPLEHRYVQSIPADATISRQTLKMVGIGLGGMSVFLLAPALLPGARPILDAALLALAALWGILLAPALFTYLGLSKPVSKYKVGGQ